MKIVVMKNSLFYETWLPCLIYCGSALLVTIAGNSFGGENQDCNIVDRFKSPFVTAYLSMPVIPYGCVSQELTETGKQVHVVNLQQLKSESSLTVHNLRTAHLLIKASNRQDSASSLDLIYVLSSDYPVEWRIQADKLRNVSLSIWVSSSSQVTPDKHIKVDVKKADLPLSPQDLLAWAHTNLSAVSSLVSLPSTANFITSLVGIDNTASEQCSLLSNLTSHPSHNVRKQQSVGCMASSTSANRIVHIIELMSAGDQVNDVIVNISARSRATHDKHLILVLKSHQHIQWHITAHRIRSMLDIITAEPVNSSYVNIQPFRVVAERLNPYSGRDLIAWTSEKYGLPVSYTRTLLANQFDVVVDGPSQSDSRRHVNQLRQVISATLSVTCSSDRTQVSLPKPTVEVFGLSKSDFTLGVSSCLASENETHIILSASNDDCGTVLSASRAGDAAIIHQNAILVHRGNEDSRHYADQSPLIINFTCSHSSVQQSSLPVSGHIKLYRDETFIDEIVQFPAVVKDTEPLFVGIGITTDEPLDLIFAKCSLESSQGVQPEKLQLIDVCQVHSSVQKISFEGKSENTASSVGLRYRLSLAQHWTGVSELLLQCKLAPCSKNTRKTGSTDGIVQCGDLEDYCSDSGFRTQQATRRALDFSIFTSTRLALQPVVDKNYTPWNYLSMPCDPEKSTDIGQGQGVSSEVVVIIAFAAFAIGVLLMSSLWFIHSRTGHLVESKRRALRSAENSGQSTPNSTVARHISTR